MELIRIRAHAKINLNLRILGRRADGYHDLRTVFQSLALHDTLTFTARSGPFEITTSELPPSPVRCPSPSVARMPVDRTNLIWKAADRLWRSTGRDGEPRDVAVHVAKRIPMKGGLGGGSSDAAATLLALEMLWDANADVRAIGRELGADVGYFFAGGAALGIGRGDELQPLADLPRVGVVLVVPRFDVSTADAYRWSDEARQGSGAGARLRSEAMKIPGCEWAEPDCNIVNDFEAVVAARYPELEEVKAALGKAGADAVAMTGSGSTVFGLFLDETRSIEAAQRLGGSGLNVLQTRTLSRDEYGITAAPERFER